MGQTTLTEEQFINLQYEIFKYKLELPAYYYHLTDNFMRKCYNGAGSNNTPQCIRWLLTILLAPCKAAVLIHDIDFTTHGCPFENANQKFVDNCQKLIDGKYSRYSIFRSMHYRTLKLISNRFITAFGTKWT